MASRVLAPQQCVRRLVEILALIVPLVTLINIVAFTLVWTAGVLVVIAKLVRRTD